MVLLTETLRLVKWAFRALFLSASVLSSPWNLSVRKMFPYYPGSSSKVGDLLPQWPKGHVTSKKPLLQMGLGWMGRDTGAVREADAKSARAEKLPLGGREGGDRTKWVGEP